MNQIFNRIYRYVKTEFSRKSNHQIISNEDDELKRIIEELEQDSRNQKNNSKSTQNSNNYYNSSIDSSNSNSKIDEAFQILGLKRTSEKEQIKKAYKKKMMEYHPDRVGFKGDDIKEMARQKSVSINQAYEVLKSNGIV